MSLSEGQLAITLALTSLVLSVVSLTIVAFLYKRYRAVNSKVTLLASALGSRAVKAYVKTVEAREERRERRRYLIVRLIHSGKLGKAELESLILNAYGRLYGSSRSSTAGLKVMDLDEGTGTAIIRFKAPRKWEVLAALGAVENLSEGKVVVIPLRVSGTLRKAKEYVRRLTRSAK